MLMTPGIFKSLPIVLNNASKKLKVVFPIHPRTMNNLKKYGLELDESNIELLDPQGYLDFLQLMQNAKAIVTDSGGIQEETTYLQIPCITLRENTERPVTIDMGTNILMSLDNDKIMSAIEQILDGNWKKGEIPPLWDGNAAVRIAGILEKYLEQKRRS